MIENLKLRTRFILLIIVIAIANIAIFLMEDFGFEVAFKNFEEIYRGAVEEIQMLSDIRNAYYQNIQEIAYQVYHGKISSEQAVNIIEDAKNKIDEIWAEYIRSIKVNSKMVMSHYDLVEHAENQKKYISTAIDNFQEAVKKDNKEAIEKLSSEEFSRLISPLLKYLYQLRVLHVEETRTDYQNAVTSMKRIKLYTILVLVGSLVFVIGILMWIGLRITNTIQKAVDIIKKLTIGDIDFKVEDPSKSELGQLLGAMNTLGISDKKMSLTLQSIAKGNLDIDVEARSAQDVLGKSLVDMIQNMKRIIGGIQMEVTNLTTSSQEIVSSVSQVATSTAETAAAVTETTTSVEELKQTAHMNSEKTKEVLGNSEETLQIVETSEKLLQATIEDMRQISEKMHIISEGIVKLSEHSQTIGEIIDSVNDLAEQSNLLAVNAAIEAAKAGEHGKGFVIVAQEIRTLAEQSKSATIQVRSILNEIQNATTKAVLATEQGAKAVEKGVSQSNQTNESMQALSISMSRVVQAANQIAISCEQQFVGVDQVKEAINNISEAASQLVDHMKQIDVAATSLNSIGQNLKDMTDQYTLSNDESKLIIGNEKSKKSGLFNEFG